MTVKDLLDVLCKYQWIEIAGDRYSESPHFVGTVKDLMNNKGFIDLYYKLNSYNE